MESITEHFNKIKETIEQEKQEISKQKEELDTEKKAWKATANKLDLASLPNIIYLDVGGAHFTTSLTTLLSSPNSFFSAMFSGRFELKADNNGRYPIDRDPEMFGYVLNFLRGTKLHLRHLTPRQRDILKEEAEFYQIEGLIAMIKPSTEFLPHSNYKLSNNNKTATCLVDGWMATVLGNTDIPSTGIFEFEISIDVTNSSCIMVGIAPKDIDQNTKNNQLKQGYYFYCANGSLYAPNESKKGASYSEKVQIRKVKTTVDMKNGTISYAINGQSKGVAFNSLLKYPATYVPCVLLYHVNDTITICE